MVTLEGKLNYRKEFFWKWQPYRTGKKMTQCSSSPQFYWMLINSSHIFILWWNLAQRSIVKRWGEKVRNIKGWAMNSRLMDGARVTLQGETARLFNSHTLMCLSIYVYFCKVLICVSSCIEISIHAQYIPVYVWLSQLLPKGGGGVSIHPLYRYFWFFVTSVTCENKGMSKRICWEMIEDVCGRDEKLTWCAWVVHRFQIYNIPSDKRGKHFIV